MWVMVECSDLAWCLMAGVVLWVVMRDWRRDVAVAWLSLSRRVAGRSHERGLSGVEDEWTEGVYLRGM